jgi:hypothetical protein
MTRKTIISMVSGASALVLAATCIPAMAYGRHGHHGGDMKLGMLAHAAGVTREQIRTAFKSDTNLKTDFLALKNAKKAMDACVIAGACNNGEIAAFANAQSALTQEKMTVWQGLFKGAPNDAQAISLKAQLDSLNAQKHSLMHQSFSSAKASGSVTPQTSQQ